MKSDRTPRVPPRTPGIYGNLRVGNLNSAANTPATTPVRLPRGKNRDTGSDSSSSSKHGDSTDEVSVYCRLRPLPDTATPEEASVQRLDEKTVFLAPPETSKAFNNGKQTQYSFKRVFNGQEGNADVFHGVALPLVKDLLQDKNGLLFTYGVTGSGKTHTMQGTLEDGGVMARAIDVIFNSLEEHLVLRKYMILPDGFNDFEPRSVAEAALAEQQEMIRGRTNSNTARERYNPKNSNHDSSNRVPDPTVLNEAVDSNRTYAVFISYCEIYNSFIYDLLEDTKDPITGRPKYDSKSLREDSYGNMYVHKCTEVEVRSPKDALEAFNKGQKRRRVAQTQLNHESSRSHAIFNIRLVKTAPSGDGEINCDQPIMVSQLALVDLAGSERCKRTGNTDKALKEAGKINNSLMNLRRCMERLRENQNSGKNSPVPYRDDRLTHLFRNYFEGIGSVKMIVCVNPRQADFDENVNVMQFAEMASEVHIERIDPIPRELRLTPGQKKAKEVIQEALRKATSKTGPMGLANADPVYSLGPSWPNVESMKSLNEDDMMNNFDCLVPFLERRIATKNTLVDDHKSKLELFRSKLVEMEKELILTKEENSSLKTLSEDQDRRIRDLEGRLVNAEATNNSLSRRIHAFDSAKAQLENELDEKELQVNQAKNEKKRMTKKYRTHVAQQEQVNSELATRLAAQAAKAERDREDKAKLNAVRNIVNQEPLTPTTSEVLNQKSHTSPKRSPRKTRSGGGSSKRSFEEFIGVSNRIAALEDNTKRPRIMSDFNHLGLDSWLSKQCSSLGMTRPTPVQQNCIPAIMEGKDVIGAAKTGSGKTLAFALPVVQTLSVDPYGIFALVLTPTRELAVQIADQFRIVGKPINIRVSVVVGGVDMVQQGRELHQKPHVVIATPGRLADLIESQDDFSLKQIKYLVLDEADRLLEGGGNSNFDGQLATIFSALPAKTQRQTLLFSATISDSIEAIRKGCREEGRPEPFVWQQDGSEGVSSDGATVAQLDQRIVLTPPSDDAKDAYLVALVEKHFSKDEAARDLVIVFTQTCRGCQVISMTLNALGFKAAALHSMISQKERTSGLAKFRSSQVRILVATDLASRGLDIPEVQLVINHNVPAATKNYVHRVGRTARAGRRGRALTLVTPHDVKLLQAVEAMALAPGTKMEEERVDEERVGEILAQVSVTKREQDVMLSETDFDERRNVNKRKKLILEGKNPEEEAKKKERYLEKKRKAARKEMHKMQKQRKLEEQDVV